ncbi:MAG: adenine glycosylase [Eggerthellaceae bacterium]|nr:adenine glycosylase [Eggerthellaceae bacterium]
MPSKRVSVQGRPLPEWPQDAPAREAFVAYVQERGRELYRDLPWRGIVDPYAVLVSEVMLQQTQVKRVLSYWPRFLSAFPTLDALAAASTSDVLELWQGLGYNRRALALKRCADKCSCENGGKLPESADELVKLPGIGPATAAGVVSFAFDRPALYLETNVRTVFLHELFPGKDGVKDTEIAPLVQMTCPQQGVRAWYYALLDYGAHLKSVLPNPSRRSAHHMRQSAFEGSRRQKRAELVRIVLASAPEGISVEAAALALDGEERAAGRPGVDAELVRSIAQDLAAEGFFKLEGGVLLP